MTVRLKQIDGQWCWRVVGSGRGWRRLRAGTEREAISRVLTVRDWDWSLVVEVVRDA